MDDPRNRLKVVDEFGTDLDRLAAPSYVPPARFPPLEVCVRRPRACGVTIMGAGIRKPSQKRTSGLAFSTSALGRFCCKSRLRRAANGDSVVLTRIAAGSIDDGPSEE
jgi:hypothetical protein